MNRVTLPIRNYAARLVIHETSGDASSAEVPTTALQVCQKLRPQLATLMGNGGFRALLTRALALATAEVPWLRMVRVNADGTLDKLDDLEQQVEAEQLIEGSSVLLGELFVLLVNFIGAALTLGMVRKVWPEIIVNDAEFFIEGSYEKAH